MSITRFIHRGKHMYGERTAFVFDHRVTSYSELHEQVSRGAAVLRQLDASEDARVGVLTAVGKVDKVAIREQRG